MSFLFAIESRSLAVLLFLCLQRRLQSFQSESLTDANHCGGADFHRFADRCVIPGGAALGAVRFEEDASVGQLSRFGFAGSNHLLKLLALIRGQLNVILFLHGGLLRGAPIYRPFQVTPNLSYLSLLS